ncbi:MAG: peroxiredoxin family protein [Myxococcales bacterium]|nr:peroxiredoxin family protein [Myxococcales bacterium]
MQRHYDDITATGAKLVLISVDPVETSKKFATKLGLEFLVASDPEMKVIDQYGVRNPDTPELALHSVFVVDKTGAIIYRKIARRRVKSREIVWALQRAAIQCCPGNCGETICAPIEDASAVP